MEFLFNVTFKNNKPVDGQFAVEISVHQAILGTIYWADEQGQPLKNYLPVKRLTLIDGRAKSITKDIFIPEEAKTLLCKAYNDSMLEIVLP